MAAHAFQRRLHARVLSKPMLLGGAWLEPGEQRTLRSASVLNQWLGSSGTGDVEGFEDIFFGFFWNIKETSSVWASQRVLHHPMGHDQCSTKPGGDILAIRVSELTANVPLMVWRLQVTDSSSAPTCGGGARLIPLQLVMIGEYWRSKWPKRIINVENESLRV